MKAINARVVWNPQTGDVLVYPSEFETSGRGPEIVAQMLTRSTRLYWDDIVPVRSFAFGTYTKWFIRAFLLVRFHTIVVRDSVPVDKAHQEFLKIDEYRAFISPDIAGAGRE